MTPRRARWERLEREAAAHARLSAPQLDVLALLRSVAVDMAGLEQLDSWRRWLEVATARQAEDEHTQSTLTEQLASSAYLTPDALAELRLTLALTRARLDARRELLELPRAIVAAERATRNGGVQ